MQKTNECYLFETVGFLPQISNEKQEQKENKKKHKKNLDKC
jgi:ATP-dependent exoDNAse (exonuclease V) alpha subunit